MAWPGCATSSAFNTCLFFAHGALFAQFNWAVRLPWTKVRLKLLYWLAGLDCCILVVSVVCSTCLTCEWIVLYIVFLRAGVWFWNLPAWALILIECLIMLSGRTIHSSGVSSELKVYLAKRKPFLGYNETTTTTTKKWEPDGVEFFVGCGFWNKETGLMNVSRRLR